MRSSLPVQNGDKVVYSKYAGTELKVQGGDYVLLKVRHSRCIITLQLLHSQSSTGNFAQFIKMPHEMLYMISLAMVQPSSSIALIHHTKRVCGKHRKKMSLGFSIPPILHSCYPLETEY